MSFDLVIKNGTVVTADAVFWADIGIQGESIAAIGQELNAENQINAAGKLVVPGAVDIHVHFQMPIGDFISSDDFFSGTRAAALGGTTTIVDFVEPDEDESMLAALSKRRAEADPRVVIDYGLHMTIGPTEIGKLGEVQAVNEAGCGSFKMYMAYGLRLDDGQLLQALEAVRQVNGLPVVHAENWDVICMLIEQNLAQGNRTPHWHPRSRPARFEGEAVGRLIELADYVGTRVHVFHVTCDEAVQAIARARRNGKPVTGETCPQYLLLTQDVYDAPGVRGAWPVCSPPIRGQEAQDALWRALSEGNLQVVTTDHCPFTSADKATGLGDFSQIPGGVPSVESRLAAVYSCGVRTGRLTLNQWVDTCCSAPAELAGFKRKGRILPGYDADLVIFDPDQQKTLSTETLHENVDWTPYEGIELVGWPEMTISRGEIVVKGGQFSGREGRGRFVARRFD
ncbi:MAG: dihydropyrimidinase [Candidatus Promineifilaceae bacterium]|nr:dihydropyrimidinase [Candidatus Promineifilaceae bacterium]